METFNITYSVGTNRNDEQRYTIRSIPENQLAKRIIGMIAKNKVIHSIERVHSRFN